MQDCISKKCIKKVRENGFENRLNSGIVRMCIGFSID